MSTLKPLPLPPSSLQGDDKPEERLNSLLNLYAVLSSDPAAQFGALLAAIKFATKSSKLAVSLSPMLRGRADVFVTALGLNEVQCLDLYLAMAGLQKLTHDKAGAKENLKLITQALKLVKVRQGVGNRHRTLWCSAPDYND
jgi:hypothetical protein